MVAFVSAVTLLVGTLHGQVMRGPTSPVCAVGKSCEAPAQHVRLLFTRDGATTTALTNAKGLYSIRLDAGIYTVRTNQQPFGRIPQPRSAKVVAGATRRLDFHIDTGIR